MIEILSVENMRKSDAACIAAGTPQSVLMERAAQALFHAVTWKEPVAIVCGKGNNGGDGHYLAAIFKEKGIRHRCFDVFSEHERGASHRFFDVSACHETKSADRFSDIPDSAEPDSAPLSSYATIVDCIFGTGFRGVPEGKAAEMIKAINEARDKGSFVVSADINSGLNGDNGLGEIYVNSDLTVAIGSFKPGHFLSMAKDVMKEKVSRDIGITPVDPTYRLLEKEDVKAFLGERKNYSHKGSYGYIALIGGSERYSGAIRLSAMAGAAMRAGAGVTAIAAPLSICASIRPEILEATLFPLSEEKGSLKFVKEEFEELLKGKKAAAIGMGIGNTKETVSAISYLLENYTGILIIDADGLNALSSMEDSGDALSSRLRRASCRVILTPHVLEMARLAKTDAKEVLARPVQTAQTFARSTGTMVLLKGPATIVTDGNRVYLTDRGCPGMATAGSGDVLSGVLCALCGAHPEDSLMAAASAAYLNGLAGEFAQKENGSISMIASDTVSCIRDAVLYVMTP